MSERIDVIGNRFISNLNQSNSKKIESALETETKASEAPASKSELNISKEAHLLERVYQAVMQSADLDESKIKAIQGKIANGELDIQKHGEALLESAKKIAGKLIDFENALSGKKTL